MLTLNRRDERTGSVCCWTWCGTRPDQVWFWPRATCWLQFPSGPAGVYLPGINIKSQKRVSPEAGGQQGEEGEDAPAPGGPERRRVSTTPHQYSTPGPAAGHVTRPRPAWRQAEACQANKTWYSCRRRQRPLIDALDLSNGSLPGRNRLIRAGTPVLMDDGNHLSRTGCK